MRGGWSTRRKLSSSPAGTSDENDHLFLFARIGANLHMRSVTAANSMAQNWGAWSDLGPVALPAPQAPPPAPVGHAADGAQPPLDLDLQGFAHVDEARLAHAEPDRRGATVKVTCTKGCSAKRWTTSPKKSTLSLKRFIRRSIKVGRIIRVEVSKPGTIASVKTLKMRRKKAPLLTSRCLPPGAKSPQRCAT